MSDDRRGFLRNLVALPLIGGSVALIGRPTAVAAQPSLDLLEAYKTWLHFEHRSLAWEMAADPIIQQRYRGAYRNLDSAEHVELAEAIGASQRFAGGSGSFHHPRQAPAASRAALVLSAVDCEWRERTNV